MLAMRYLTNAFGNIIDVVVIAALEGVFSSQVICLYKSTENWTHKSIVLGLNNAFDFVIGLWVLPICGSHGAGHDFARMDGDGLQIRGLYYWRGSSKRWWLALQYRCFVSWIIVEEWKGMNLDAQRYISNNVHEIIRQ